MPVACGRHDVQCEITRAESWHVFQLLTDYLCIFFHVSYLYISINQTYIVLISIDEFKQKKLQANISLKLEHKLMIDFEIYFI